MTTTSEDGGRFTPGPWYVAFRKMGTGVSRMICAQQGGEESPVAVINGAGRTASQNEANAALIAAAPDLLAALKDLAGLVSKYPHYFSAGEANMAAYLTAADAAIAKARSSSTDSRRT